MRRPKEKACKNGSAHSTHSSKIMHIQNERCGWDGGGCATPLQWATPYIIIVALVIIAIAIRITVARVYRRHCLNYYKKKSNQKYLSSSAVQNGEESNLETFSLTPYASMTFKQVVIPTLFEKILNFLSCLKKLFDSLETYIPDCIVFFVRPILEWISTILSLAIFPLKLIFKIMAPPFMVYIEAKEHDGSVRQFLLKDERPRLARILGFGEIMHLTLLGDHEKVLMRSVAEDVRSACAFFCCFLWTALDRRVFSTVSPNANEHDTITTTIDNSGCRILRFFSNASCGEEIKWEYAVRGK
jgi:hypothetical protein